MRRFLIGLALVVAIPLCAAPGFAADGAPGKVADLAWMTGHWAGAMPNGGLEENWTEPKAGSIAALVRATTGEATSMIELIVIEEESGSLVLRVQQWNPGYVPRTPTPQVMRLAETAPNKVVFTSTGEGALARLAYSRPAPDQFVISIKTAQGAEFDIPLKAK
jgi:hypothetical protein